MVEAIVPDEEEAVTVPWRPVEEEEVVRDVEEILPVPREAPSRPFSENKIVCEDYEINSIRNNSSRCPIRKRFKKKRRALPS